MEKSIFSLDYGILLKCLRRARKRAGLSQVELAERLGQTQSFVSKCERGERRLDLVEVRAFSLAFGTTLIDLARDFEHQLAERDLEAGSPDPSP